MDYRDKYLRYKTKYLKLKNIDVNNQLGGGKKSNDKTNDNIKLIPKKSISPHFIELDFPDIIVSQCEYTEGPCGLTFIRSNNKYLNFSFRSCPLGTFQSP